ncbi:MAG TPA: hypothetical protein VJN67_21465 [Stellaceae bacterium]|nr:hypothetical protein [Stellaceae bacterium]
MTVPAIFQRLRRPRTPSTADMLRDAIGNENPEAASDYIRQTVGAQASSALPEFNQQLQSIRENAIRRGITGGDLGTSYEGDLASAFQRNIANSVSSHAYDAYQTSRNRYLDLLTGQRDYETAQENARRKRGSFLGNLLGTAAGAFGGPLLGAAGKKLGEKLF